MLNTTEINEAVESVRGKMPDPVMEMLDALNQTVNILAVNFNLLSESLKGVHDLCDDARDDQPATELAEAIRAHVDKALAGAES